MFRISKTVLAHAGKTSPESGNDLTMFKKNIRTIEVTDSTNLLLKAEAESGLAREGAVIRAEHQIMGRGRLSRCWESPPGKSLLFSALLYPDIPHEGLPLIGLAVSLAVIDGLEEWLSKWENNGTLSISDINLKWPNDILVGGKKLCGILCESSVGTDGRRFVVAGVGLNVNQCAEDFSRGIRGTATSLYMLTRSVNDRDTLFGLILEQLDVYYDKINKYGSGWVARAWIKRAGITGKEVIVSQQNERIRGVCVGIEPSGALLLKTEDGKIVAVHSGDTRFVING